MTHDAYDQAAPSDTYEASLVSAQTDLTLLNADELEAVQFFISKCLAGKAKHGPLDLDSDDRDWLEEIVQEQADSGFYFVFWLMKTRRARAAANRKVAEAMDRASAARDAAERFDLSEAE